MNTKLKILETIVENGIKIIMRSKKISNETKERMKKNLNELLEDSKGLL